MKNLKRLWLVSICSLIGVTSLKSQFIGIDIDSSLTPVDVRKGSIVEYSMATDAKPGEEFRWEVTGGIIITPGAIGNGTTTNPSVIEFTADRHTIEIQWQSDDSTSAIIHGSIMVQMKTLAHCSSAIRKQKINQWSMPTASIDKGYPDFTICSGEEVGGYIVVNLTGAANFTYQYSIKSNGLFDESGSAINTEFIEITSTNDSAHIALPARLINPSKAASKYFTIELTAMNDDFLGNGEIVSDKKEFTITVYPAAGIGGIESIKLNRR